MITAERARELLALWEKTGLQGCPHLARTVIALSEGRISCARCSAPMLAQDPDNTPDNDNLEVCSRCTRAIYAEEMG